AECGGHEAGVRHRVKQVLLEVEVGIPDGGGLQAVAQRLVVQVDPGARPIEGRARLVPVVNQLALVHDRSVALSPGTVKRVSVDWWSRPFSACCRTTVSVRG